MGLLHQASEHSSAMGMRVHRGALRQLGGQQHGMGLGSFLSGLFRSGMRYLKPLAQHATTMAKEAAKTPLASEIANIGKEALKQTAYDTAISLVKGDSLTDPAVTASSQARNKIISALEASKRRGATASNPTTKRRKTKRSKVALVVNKKGRRNQKFDLLDDDDSD